MIRLMTSKDIIDVQKIVHETWHYTYAHPILQEKQTQFLQRTYSDMMLMMRMEKTIMLIAECDGLPIGFANCTKTDIDGDAELTAMYILPQHQRLGYGEKLLQHAFSHLDNTTQLFVYVDEENAIGRNFCEKQGFHFIECFAEHFEGQPVQTAQYVYHTISNPG